MCLSKIYAVAFKHMRISGNKKGKKKYEDYALFQSFLD